MLREGRYISVYGPGAVFRVWPKNHSLCLHHQVQFLGLVMKPGNEVAVLPATTAVVAVGQLRIGLSSMQQTSSASLRLAPSHTATDCTPHCFLCPLLSA